MLKIHPMGVRSLLATLSISIPLLAQPAQAAKPGDEIDLSACASLPAARSDQFHGYPLGNDLSLFMAGNQFVVFDKVLEGFNHHIGTDPTDLTQNPKYYIELVPPGQEANQIIAGCMYLGEENPENFLPLTITTTADVFASTNINLMDKVADAGFIYKTRKYIKNKLDLLVPEGNPKQIGTGANPDGTTFTDGIVDVTLDLLDPQVAVSEVDHINEGIHRGINKMYKLMDAYVRSNGTAQEVAMLDAALAAVKNPQPGSPAETRTIEEGITTNFNLETNAECNYGDGVDANGDGDFDDAGDTPPTLRLCEFAVLNKANTHETRVHHIETAARVRDGSSDTGPLWISEVIFARLQAEDVEGVDIAGLDPAEEVNQPVTYYITVVDKTVKPRHKRLAVDFVNFLRSPEGQAIYEAGGFIPLSDEELAFEKVYEGNENVIRVSPSKW